MPGQYLFDLRVEIPFTTLNFILTRPPHRIINPLAGIPKPVLREQVASFCREYNFVEDEDVFFRGALAAQSPKDFENIPELTPEDKHAIRRETTHKWSLPRGLIYGIALCSLGSAIQGWDNTGASGAL